MRRTIWRRRWLPVALLMTVMISGCKDNRGSLDDASPMDGSPGDTDAEETEDPSTGSPDGDADGQDSDTDAAPGSDANTNGGLIGRRDASTDAAEGGSSDAAPDPETDAGTHDAALGAASPCGPIFANGEVLLDLRHTSGVDFARRAGTRIVSRDADRWILFDATTGAQITSDNISLARRRMDLAAGTLMVERSDNGAQIQYVDLRAASDGHLLMTVSAKTAATYWSELGLAPDGSYLWGASPSKLTAWSTSGQVLAEVSGDYSRAKIVAAPGELRVASGPAGAIVIQTISTSTGSATTGPTFAGTFQAWFSDGTRFLTTAGLTVRVYSKASVQEDIVSLPHANHLAGGGNYFWTSTQTEFAVYAIGGGSTPVMTRPGAPAVIGRWLVVRSLNGTGDGRTIDVLDLSGTSLSEKSIPVPISAGLRHADADGNWVSTGLGGAVYASSSPDGWRQLSCGAPTSIVGAPSGHAAVSFNNGDILYFDLGNGERNLEVLSAGSRTLFARSLSSDGSMLVTTNADANGADWVPDELKVLSMPDGDVLRTLQSPGSLSYAALAAGGTRLGAASTASGTCVRSVTSLSGDMTYFCADPYQSLDVPSELGLPAMAVSPDGTLVAAPEGTATDIVGTKIYKNGAFVGAAAGYAVGWIDDSRLLVQTYSHSNNDIYGLDTTTICDPSGAVLASPAMPWIPAFQTVSSDEIYLPITNTIHSLTDGSAVWTSPNTDERGSKQGAIVGPYVVFLSDHKLFIEAY